MDSSPFVEYHPPARDAFSLPPHLLYVSAGLLLVLVGTYAIVGHLIDDLLHDMADWVLGAEAGGESVCEEVLSLHSDPSDPLMLLVISP